MLGKAPMSLPVGKCDQHHLKAADPTKFHRRNAIGVATDQDDPVDLAGERKMGDVEADPHIDLLLFEAGPEVFVPQLVRCDWNMFRLESAK